MASVLRVALLGHSSTHEEFTYAFGLYRIAAHCRSLGMPHEIEVLDRAATSDEDDDFERIAALSPHVVGLSAFLWNLPRIVRLVARIRRDLPAALVVVGGPSATGFEELAGDGTRPDLVVVGFGERPFAAILAAHAEGRLRERLSEVGQVVSWLGGNKEVLGQPHVESDLDVLASPYLDGTIDPRGRDTLYVETDRGCPYSCAFCIESTAPPKVARFSLSRIEAELAWARAHGFRQIELCSAIFNLDTEWLEAFVTMVERIDPDRRLAFSAALFTTHLDERQAELFGRLEMKSALFGLNTINPATFKGVRRVIHPERFREKIELFARHARPQVSLIMGLPGDTPEGLRQTLQFAATLPADLMLFRFMVLPRTLYWERRHALALEIDFERSNRILATHSYDREDLQRMEAIAAAAGFHEVNPGEWVLRLEDERYTAPDPMPRPAWTLLYLALRRMAVHERAWPGGWRHVRVFLEVERFAGVTFADTDGEQISIYVSRRSDRRAAFHHSRHFELSVRTRPRRGAADAQGREPTALLSAFAAAFDEAERTQILERIRTRSIA
jgi:radical SAM superfamily enzyme YgiQ (UPF0313 family)